jgi:DNA-directed RNA polymerase specialized sigma24 family protein
MMEKVMENQEPKNEKTSLYAQYLKMAYSLGHKIALAYNADANELCEEAASILAQIVAQWPGKYDPKKSSPCTWIYQGIYHELLNYCTRHKPRERRFSDIEKDDTKPLQIGAKEGWLDTLFLTLSDDAKILITTILAAPADLIEDISPQARRQKKVRAAICRYMREQGWAPSRVCLAWREVSECLT